MEKIQFSHLMDHSICVLESDIVVNFYCGHCFFGDGKWEMGILRGGLSHVEDVEFSILFLEHPSSSDIQNVEKWVCEKNHFCVE